MAETTTAPQPKSPREFSADRDAFAQVAKWMAIIRKVSQEQPKN